MNHMDEIWKILISLAVLLLGVPIGNFLAKITKEELKMGKIWFQLLMFIGVVGGIISLIFRSDALMFTFFFIAIVTSRSLK